MGYYEKKEKQIDLQRKMWAFISASLCSPTTNSNFFCLSKVFFLQKKGWNYMFASEEIKKNIIITAKKWIDWLKEGL